MLILPPNCETLPSKKQIPTNNQTEEAITCQVSVNEEYNKLGITTTARSKQSIVIVTNADFNNGILRITPAPEKHKLCK